MSSRFLVKVFLVLSILVLLGGWFVLQEQPTAETIVSSPSKEQESNGELVVSEQSILLEVPFSSQAPSAQWNDVVFQNACEETAILMAMRWAEDATLSKEDAEREIAAIAEFQKETYGHFHDRSAADTAQLMKEYFDYQNVEYVTDIDTSDIKRELLDGNVVIVPVNGQVLNNPFYTPPGPLEHMIVVVGYDEETHEFITHDPGTKRGANFRYEEDVLNQALRDYGTGYHETIKGVSKVMIVVKPLSRK